MVQNSSLLHLCLVTVSCVDLFVCACSTSSKIHHYSTVVSANDRVPKDSVRSEASRLTVFVGVGTMGGTVLGTTSRCVYFLGFSLLWMETVVSANSAEITLNYSLSSAIFVGETTNKRRINLIHNFGSHSLWCLPREISDFGSRREKQTFEFAHASHRQKFMIRSFAVTCEPDILTLNNSNVQLFREEMACF